MAKGLKYVIAFASAFALMLVARALVVSVHSVNGNGLAPKVPCDSVAGIYIARWTAIPGDTIRTINGPLLVPGLVNCAKTDYYWLEAINQKNPVDSRHLGFIAESQIIGRVVTVLYNRHNIRLQ